MIRLGINIDHITMLRGKKAGAECRAAADVTTSKVELLPNLDGLRGLACAMVVYFHAGLYSGIAVVSGLGDAGVMLFLSLSGFLMAYHYLPNEFSWRYWLAFYIRRFFRLYPAFFIALLGCIMFSPHLPAAESLLGKSWGNMFQGWLLQGQMGLFWTVRLELLFYAKYPLLVALLMWNKSRIFGFAVLLLTWILSGFSVTGFLGGASIFFLGGITAAYLLKHTNTKHHVSRRVWSYAGVSSLAIIFLILAYSPADINQAHAALYNNSIFLAPLFALCVLSIALSDGIVKHIFANPAARFLGKISYSMYLTHIFVQTMQDELFPPYSEHAGIMFILVLVIASIFYVLVEQPFHQLGKKLAKPFSA